MCVCFCGLLTFKTPFNPAICKLLGEPGVQDRDKPGISTCCSAGEELRLELKSERKEVESSQAERRGGISYVNGPWGITKVGSEEACEQLPGL